MTLSKKYLATALIRGKYKIFNENFITISELNQFDHFMQKEFNNRNLGIVITSDSLNKEDFIIIDGIVIPSEKCCYDVNRLPYEILNILTDDNLIAKFFMELEQKRIKVIENLQEKNVEEEKHAPLILQKSNGKSISNLDAKKNI